MIEGGSVARAKHTVRAEARRRYRQASNQPIDDADPALDADASLPAAGAARTTAKAEGRPAATPSGRPGFMAAFRGAYHPAHLREDLGHLPQLLTSRALLAAVGLVIAGGGAWVAFPNYDGAAFAWELLVLPGSALAPQLVAGFFAPRASYLLGLLVGLAQGVVFVVIAPQMAARIGTPLTSEQTGSLLTLSFVTGPVSGTLFAAAAAWYRRFLALSSPRRAQAGRGSPGRAPSKATPQRRTGGR
jgi:hypothetical protein